MALTTVTIPTGFQPIAGKGNSLTYVFNESSLGGKDNYRVEITVWDSDSGLQITTIPTLSYSADYSNGNITCDIAAAVRTILKFDKLGSALPAGQKLPNHYRRIFIKYEGVWTGSSTGVTSLSGSVAVVFNGTKHVDSDPLGTFPAEYVNSDSAGTGKVLRPTPGRIVVWSGQRAFLDFLMNTTSSKFNRLDLQITEKASTLQTHSIVSWRPPRETSLYLWGVDFLLPTMIDAKANLVMRMDLTNVTEWGETQNNTRRVDPSFGTVYGQTFTPAAGGTFHMITLYKVERIGSPTFSIDFEIWSTTAGLPNALLGTYNKKIYHHPSGADLTITIDSLTLNAATQYALIIRPKNDGVGNVGNRLNVFSSSASAFGGGTEIVDSGGGWGTAAGDMNGADSVFCTWQAGTTPVEFVDSAILENMVYLTWLADVGGRVSWGFDFSQDFGYKIETDRRARNVRLFATGVTAEEWRMINELSKSGTRYSDFKKIGQRVLDLTKVAAYQDVFVVPTMDRTRTRATRPSAEVTIEYKELPPNQVTQ